MDYVNNILTLDQPLAWNAGQGVSLQYGGKAPDLGAFELVSPTLGIRLAGRSLALSWPLGFDDYMLQSATSLQPGTNNWQSYSNAVANGTQWVVNIPLPNTTSFFRLTR